MSIVFVPLPNTFRCELIYSYMGQVMENVFHVKTGSGLTAADATRIAGKLKSWWQTNLAGQTSNTLSLQRIEVVDASVQGGVGIIYVTGLPITGANPNTTVPAGCSVAMKWGTGLTGKSFRGRTFYAGLCTNHLTGNQITTAHQTYLQAAGAALITALQAGGTVDILVVGSKRHNKAWRTTGVTTDVTSCTVEINVDSQRRRLTGPGRGN